MSVATKGAAREEFLPLMRELARAYQAFAAYDASGYKDTDLTVPQADVIFALGHTTGLTFTEIGERTLITKGTLTGVVDRLEEKKLVKRVASSEDRRCTRVTLTAKGKGVFEKEFPRQIEYLKQRFENLSPSDRQTASRSLRQIKELF